MTKARSQYGEDGFILNHFHKRTGVFLDVGAADGHTFSNTGQLAEIGWEGICIEPSPRQFPYLLEYHKEHEGVVCIQGALWTSSELVDFYDSVSIPFFSSIDSGRVKDRRFKHVVWSRFTVPTFTWGQLLEKYPGPYDFVNIDVEGVNAEVTLSCPLHKLEAELFCVENDLHGRYGEVLEHLGQAGYEEPYRIGGNLLFWKK